MNLKNIKALAEILNENELTSLEVSEGDFSIKIEKASNTPVMKIDPKVLDCPIPTVVPKEQGLDFNNIIEVKSPLVGVYYDSPLPDAPPFVSVGEKVKKGDILCIVEAMKMMNEITAEVDGEIVDMCLKDGDIAEFGQVLFKII